MSDSPPPERIYVKLHSISVPSAPNYWVTALLVVDEDLEGITQLASPKHRSDEYQSGPPGAPAPPPIELLTPPFTFEAGTMLKLAVQDPRLIVEVISLSPGDGAMSALAKDVYPIKINSVSGDVVPTSEFRFLTSLVRHKQVQVGSYRIEVSNKPLGTAKRGAESSLMQLPHVPTTIIEEAEIDFDTPQTSTVIQANHSFHLDSQILACTDIMPRNGKQPAENYDFNLSVHMVSNTDNFRRTLGQTRPSKLTSVGSQWHETISVDVDGKEVASDDRWGFEVVMVPPSTEVGSPAALETVAWFPVPLAHLRPNHLYTLELLTRPSRNKQFCPRLYVTIRLSEPSARSPDEPVLLVHADSSLSGQLAVGYLVSDLEAKEKELGLGITSHDRSDTKWTVTVPDSKSSDYNTPQFGALRGSPRSLPQAISDGSGSKYLKDMRFTAKMVHMFSMSSALCIEVYKKFSAEEASLQTDWLPPKDTLIGYAFIHLTNELKNRLVHNKEIQHGVDLKSTTGSSINMPVSFNIQLLLPEGYEHERIQNSTPDAPALSLDLPWGNNVSPNQNLMSPKQGMNLNTVSSGKKYSSSQVTQEGDEMATLSALNDELAEKIRTGVNRIMEAREELKELSDVGAKLGADLERCERATKITFEGTNLESAPRTTLIQAYTDASRLYALETSRGVDYNRRIQQLQNDLIASNEAEREHLKLEEQHMRVCAQVQQLQQRARQVARVELVVKQQREVIRKLEQLISDAPGKGIDAQTRIDSMAHRAIERRVLTLRSELRNARKNASGLQDGRSTLRSYLGQSGTGVLSSADPKLVSLWIDAKAKNMSLKEERTRLEKHPSSKSSQLNNVRAETARQRIESINQRMTRCRRDHDAQRHQLKQEINALRHPVAKHPSATFTKERSIELPRTPPQGASRLSFQNERPMSARTVELQTLISGLSSSARHN